MVDEFKYDVFLSHSSKDKAVVRAVAKRLRTDGLRVWLDDWEIQPGDSIPAKIEEGLEHSRVLVLFMSAHAFGSDWTQLEPSTFRFKDPLNKERRFIPVRLDDTPARGSLAQFSFIDWRKRKDASYDQLLDAVKSSPSATGGQVLTAHGGASLVHLSAPQHTVKLTTATRPLRCAAFNADGLVACGAGENHVRVFSWLTGRELKKIAAHHKTLWGDHDEMIDGPREVAVYCLAFSSDGNSIASGGADESVSLSNVRKSTRPKNLRLNNYLPTAVAVNHQASVAVVAMCSRFFGSMRSDIDRESKAVIVWRPRSRTSVVEIESYLATKSAKFPSCFLEGHSERVLCLAIDRDGRRAVSGAADGSLRLWDLDARQCLLVLKGHSSEVLSVALSGDGGRVLSGSRDDTMRLWDANSGICVRVYEGHTDAVGCVAFSLDGRHGVSGSADKTVRVWDLDTGHCLDHQDGYADRMINAAFGPPGIVLTITENGEIRAWRSELRSKLTP